MQQGSELELVKTFELEAEAEEVMLLTTPSQQKAARTVVSRAATAALTRDPEMVAVDQESQGGHPQDVADDDSDYF